MNTPFITASNITIRIGNKFLFTGDSWTMNRGEHWAVIGPNGSGKSTLAKALAGKLSVVGGIIRVHFGDLSRPPYPASQREYIGYLSFDTHRSIIEKEEKESEFLSYLGKEHMGQNVENFLNNSEVIKLLALESLTEKRLSHLSTGEMRKVLIAKFISNKPQLLILDEPFEGLDTISKKSLIKFVDRLSSENIQLLLITHNKEEILSAITHIMMVKNGHIVLQTRKENFLDSRFEKKRLAPSAVALPQQSSDKRPDVVVEMSAVSVKYGDKVILDKINWTIKSGENWMIVGPNGAGKSTLVKLINGDNLQVYSNSIKVFGYNRGDSQGTWKIRKNIGYISSDFHINYRESITAFNVVLSGFFDTIGLYVSATEKQKKTAHEWFKKLNIQELKNHDFMTLSLGQQRLILIIRALVKSPKLLILDEPTYGLDSQNRHKILQVIDEITSLKTQIIYITHNKNDIVTSITDVLEINHGKIKVYKPEEVS